jgi:osmotically-inducible protein OsmY
MSRRIGDLAIGAALGSALTYFFQRGGGRAERAGRAVGAKVYGMRDDDATLARRVESELFRNPDVPEGQIDVNVLDGFVQLRGEVPRPDLIEELLERAHSIEGVRDVENLLHVPYTEPQLHQ